MASINGETEIVINQLMTVNDMTRKEAVAYISESFKKHSERSVFDWELDISYLDEYIKGGDNWWEIL